MAITREQYAAAIPTCCGISTIEDHENIMLCWSLCDAIEHGTLTSCDYCPENVELKPAESAPKGVVLKVAGADGIRYAYQHGGHWWWYKEPTYTIGPTPDGWYFVVMVCGEENET